MTQTKVGDAPGSQSFPVSDLYIPDFHPVIGRPIEVLLEDPHIVDPGLLDIVTRARSFALEQGRTQLTSRSLSDARGTPTLSAELLATNPSVYSIMDELGFMPPQDLAQRSLSHQINATHSSIRAYNRRPDAEIVAEKISPRDIGRLVLLEWAQLVTAGRPRKDDIESRLIALERRRALAYRGAGAFIRLVTRNNEVSESAFVSLLCHPFCVADAEGPRGDDKPSLTGSSANVFSPPYLEGFIQYRREVLREVFRDPFLVHKSVSLTPGFTISFKFDDFPENAAAMLTSESVNPLTSVQLSLDQIAMQLYASARMRTPNIGDFSRVEWARNFALKEYLRPKGHNGAVSNVKIKIMPTPEGYASKHLQNIEGAKAAEESGTLVLAKISSDLHSSGRKKIGTSAKTLVFFPRHDRSKLGATSIAVFARQHEADQSDSVVALRKASSRNFVRLASRNAMHPLNAGAPGLGKR